MAYKNFQKIRSQPSVCNGSGQNFTISLKERNQEIAQDFQQISVVQSQLLISNEENDKMKTQWAIVQHCERWHEGAGVADSEGE